jgi:aldehyde dehydrogenase (NAD+)
MQNPIVGSTGQYLTYVDGAWRESFARDHSPNVNPANAAEVLGFVPECTRDEVDSAMGAAQSAFMAWRKVSGNIKTKIFLHTAQVLQRDYDYIVRTMTREMGKTHFDARLDLDEAIGVIEAVAPQGLSLKGETYQKNVDGIVMESRLEPRGVAAIITPFNFPVAIPLAQLVAALVTGNTVVWKPSHLIPESSQAALAAILESFAWAEDKFGVTIPSGTVNLVFGDAFAGNAMVTHKTPKVLSFTGSKAVGDHVDSQASALGKRVMKEVGGINCFYVHAKADLPRAVRNFVYGKTITAGQRCTSIQEVLVDAAVYDEFVCRAIAESAGIVIGDGASRELADADATPGKYSLPPLVSEEQRDRVERVVAEAVAQGASIRHTVEVPEWLKSHGWYSAFRMIENVGPGNVLYDSEIFGPVAVITKVSGLTEAIEIINAKVGIVACIDSEDKNATETFIQNVLRTRIDDGRHGTGAFWATRFGGDRGAGSGNPALDENMVYGYVLWKTIYRAYTPLE